MGLRQLRHHKKTTGKVYGSSVNALRKRYCNDLATGVAHNKKGKPIVKNGEVETLSPRQMSYRAGVVEGISLSSAATKTKAGINTSRQMHNGIVIKSNASMPGFAVKGKAKANIKK